jgi:hypothetical protein
MTVHKNAPQYVLVPLSSVPGCAPQVPLRPSLERAMFQEKLRAFAREDLFTRSGSSVSPEMRYGRFVQGFIDGEKEKRSRLGKKLLKDDAESEPRPVQVRDGFDMGAPSSFAQGFKLFFPSDEHQECPRFNPEGRMFKLLQLPLLIMG